jgi:ribosomal protein L16 Arg81 hydroxylase
MSFIHVHLLPTQFDELALTASLDGWTLSINWTASDSEGNHWHQYGEYLIDLMGNRSWVSGDKYPF